MLRTIAQAHRFGRRAGVGSCVCVYCEEARLRGLDGAPAAQADDAACRHCGGTEFYGGSCTKCHRDRVTGQYAPEFGPT